MLENLLRTLRYNENTHISYIKAQEHSQRYDEYNILGKKVSNIVSAISSLQEKLNNLINDEPKGKIGNLLLQGYNYGINRLDPTIQEIWEEIIKDSKNKEFVVDFEKQIEFANAKKENASKITTTINSIFEKLSYGLFLYERLSDLTFFLEVVKENNTYFLEAYEDEILGDEFVKDVKYIHILNSLNYKYNETIVGLELKEHKVNAINREFLSIKTPDSKRMLQDRIQEIQNKLKTEKDILGSTETNFYLKGNLIGIRGLNPTLLEIMKENSRYVFYNSSYHFSSHYSEYFGENPLINTKNLLLMILEGYALSYHLKFLENYENDLIEKSKTQKDEVIVSQLLIVLKWTGQKNQLYQVLRQLKEQNLIANSYEDLAVFLKQNVDVFKNTALSTIQTELGKNKKPPKSRRVEIN